MLDLFKMFAASASALIVGMLGFWLTEGKDYVKRDEVRLMIQNEAPYNTDRTWIKELIERNTRAIETLNDTMVQVRIEIGK